MSWIVEATESVRSAKTASGAKPPTPSPTHTETLSKLPPIVARSSSPSPLMSRAVIVRGGALAGKIGPGVNTPPQPEQHDQIAAVGAGNREVDLHVAIEVTGGDAHVGLRRPDIDQPARRERPGPVVERELDRRDRRQGREDVEVAVAIEVPQAERARGLRQVPLRDVDPPRRTDRQLRLRQLAGAIREATDALPRAIVVRVALGAGDTILEGTDVAAVAVFVHEAVAEVARFAAAVVAAAGALKVVHTFRGRARRRGRRINRRFGRRPGRRLGHRPGRRPGHRPGRRHGSRPGGRGVAASDHVPGGATGAGHRYRLRAARAQQTERREPRAIDLSQQGERAHPGSVAQATWSRQGCTIPRGGRLHRSRAVSLYQDDQRRRRWLGWRAARARRLPFRPHFPRAPKSRLRPPNRPVRPPRPPRPRALRDPAAACAFAGRSTLPAMPDIYDVDGYRKHKRRGAGGPSVLSIWIRRQRRRS
jgi:hypothetical protein